MKRIFSFSKTFYTGLFMVFSLIATGQTQTNIYVQAHEDDWQLFMSQNIIKNVSPNSKAVFITLTAGDAGHGNHSFADGLCPYYRAREKGAVYSTKFAVDIAGISIDETPAPSVVTIDSQDSTKRKLSHQITKYTYKNTVNYFLRLPDGHITGNGFQSTGNQSLQRLNQKQISNLSAVDNSTTYADWTDLTTTLRAIIQAEAIPKSEIWINCASLDSKFNKNDHSDHIFTSHAIQQAVSVMPEAGIIEWADYNTKKMKHNLSKEGLENATALFGVYSWALCENRYLSQFNNDHKQWLGMDYFSVKRIPRQLIDNPSTIDSTTNKPKKIARAIPLLVSMSNPNKQNEDISLLLSPFESGTVEIHILNTAGGVVCTNTYLVQKDKPANIQISQNLEPRSFYLLEIILNGKYKDTRKLIIN